MAFDQPLAPRPTTALSRRAWQVPAPWKQAGRMVALSAATIAAEAGLAWLQRRQQHIVPTTQTPTTARIVALGWRVTETWQNGHLQQRVEEQVMWLEPGSRRR